AVAGRSERPARRVLADGHSLARGSLSEPVHDLLRVGPAALKTGSECSFTSVNSASLPVFALQDSSSRDREQSLSDRGFWSITQNMISLGEI
ncbi:hypothetical protein, partial [Stutzerimonas nitrititolerans]|uniref:hypothetical protein n=1 Tax=Stutzerimonas nitrititolerans TaxID=2482751 RepID=UPI00289AFEB0